MMISNLWKKKIPICIGSTLLFSFLCAFFASENNDDRRHHRERRDSEPTDILSDHLELSNLFHAIQLNCGFLSGEINSNNTLNVFWGIDISKFMKMNLKDLAENLKDLAETIEYSPPIPTDKINYASYETAILHLQDLKTKQEKFEKLVSEKLKLKPAGRLSELDGNQTFCGKNSTFENIPIITDYLQKINFDQDLIEKGKKQVKIIRERMRAIDLILFVFKEKKDLIPKLNWLIEVINFLNKNDSQKKKKKLFNVDFSNKFLRDILEVDSLEIALSPLKIYGEEVEKLEKKLKYEKTEEDSNLENLLKKYPGIRGNRLDLHQTLRNGCLEDNSMELPDFENIKADMNVWKEFLETSRTNKTCFSKKIEKDQTINISRTYSNLESFENWAKSFKMVGENCTFKSVEQNPIQHLEQFSDRFKTLRRENPISKINKKVIPLLNHGQRNLRNLSRISRKVQKNPFNLPVYSIELCNRMKPAQKYMTHFRMGLEFLHKVFKLTDEKWKVESLLRIRKMDIEGFEFQPWSVQQEIEKLDSKSEEVQRVFKDIEDLKKFHGNTNWSRLSDLSKIYRRAETIRNPINWNILADAGIKHSYAPFFRELANLQFDLGSAYLSFQKATVALEKLDETFQGFFKWTVRKPASKYYLYLGYCISFSSFLLLLLGSIAFLIYFDRPTPILKRKDGIEQQFNAVASEESRRYWPQMFQFSRLAINKRNKKGKTELFTLVSKDDKFDFWYLIAQDGLAVNAACGQKARTALHVACKRGNYDGVQKLLQRGANPNLVDSEGRRPIKYASKNSYIKGIFASYFEKPKQMRQAPARYRLDRHFYVLIVEKTMFPEEYLEYLPEDIEVVYGYEEGIHNLNEFTHFVVATKSAGSKDLELELENPLGFEILSKPGMIVSVEWLDACLDDAHNVENDWKFLLENVSFDGYTHENVITRIKTDIHELRPPLLAGCTITILPTNNRLMKRDLDSWIRIIRGFGGDHTKTPFPSIESEIIYHLDTSVKEKEEKTKTTLAREEKSKESEEAPPPQKLYPSIVLAFSDSVIRERWTYPENNISILGMGWLPESIVRYKILRENHDSLKFEVDYRQLPKILEYEGEKWNKEEKGKEEDKK